jgi:hypothetical protein
MPGFTLRNLAERWIAIDLNINGRPIRLRGRGELAENSDVGSILKIHVPDEDGDFDVILHESRFAGSIVEVTGSDCDFRIALQASDLAPQSS